MAYRFIRIDTFRDVLRNWNKNDQINLSGKIKKYSHVEPILIDLHSRIYNMYIGILMRVCK